MEKETQVTETAEINETNAEKFIKHFNIPLAGGKKRILKRVGLFLTDENCLNFTEKSARVIVQICKDPGIVTFSINPVTGDRVDFTRSQKVMAYREADKQLKLIAQAVVLRGTDLMNAATMSIREHQMSSSTRRLREMLLSEFSF